MVSLLLDRSSLNFVLLEEVTDLREESDLRSIFSMAKIGPLLLQLKI